ncbi:MAG: histone deacetylase family protein [Candidatus Lokiarchaeota archaeon]|nr:histone deacetylase family protein [Candidatus Lokiarchaeota archaeon]
MKVIFHEDFYNVYESDPAAAAGRLEPIVRKILDDPFYQLIEPVPAKKEDILRVHTERHFQRIQSDAYVFLMAMLAAGGAIQAADIAYTEKTATFGLIRPPGHHASRDSCWGFCFFNNIAVSLLYLMQKYPIHSAFILDFDLHTGDGNINILEGYRDVYILNPYSHDEIKYVREIEEKLLSLKNVDIFICSAGFDNAQGDWGGVLSTESYHKIGMLLKKYSQKLCEGRRYALLEGGYNYSLMPTNFDGFCKGFG